MPFFPTLPDFPIPRYMQAAYEDALAHPSYTMKLPPPVKQLESIFTTDETDADRYEYIGDRNLYSLIAYLLESKDRSPELRESIEFIVVTTKILAANHNLVRLMDTGRVGYRQRIHVPDPKYIADLFEHILGVSYKDNPLEVMMRWAEGTLGPLVDALWDTYRKFKSSDSQSVNTIPPTQLITSIGRSTSRRVSQDECDLAYDLMPQRQAPTSQPSRRSLSRPDASHAQRYGDDFRAPGTRKRRCGGGDGRRSTRSSRGWEERDYADERSSSLGLNMRYPGARSYSRRFPRNGFSDLDAYEYPSSRATGRHSSPRTYLSRDRFGHDSASPPGSNTRYLSGSSPNHRTHRGDFSKSVVYELGSGRAAGRYGSSHRDSSRDQFDRDRGSLSPGPSTRAHERGRTMMKSYFRSPHAPRSRCRD